jgi:hypothetical protein
MRWGRSLTDYFYDSLEPTPEPYPEELLAEAKAGEVVFDKRGHPRGVRLYDAQGRFLTGGVFLQNGDTVSFEIEVTLNE